MAPVSTVPAVPTTRNGVKPRIAIRRDSLLQSRQVDPLPAVDGNQPQRFASQPSEIKRSPNASMHGHRRIGGQLLRGMRRRDGEPRRPGAHPARSIPRASLPSTYR